MISKSIWILFLLLKLNIEYLIFAYNKKATIFSLLIRVIIYEE